MYLLAICMSLWKNVYSDPLLIFQLDYFFILSCMSALCILDINLLSDILFANIFSHSVDCLFILLVVSEKKANSFCRFLQLRQSPSARTPERSQASKGVCPGVADSPQSRDAIGNASQLQRKPARVRETLRFEIWGYYDGPG